MNDIGRYHSRPQWIMAAGRKFRGAGTCAPNARFTCPPSGGSFFAFWRAADLKMVTMIWNVRGSVWNRWDSHLHAPGTLLTDHFKGDWEAYLSAVENSSP
jgi:hypothetical protein